MITEDGDGSSGLSEEEEFHAFIAGVADASSFEELPWLFKVVHKSLVCRYQVLGLGDRCCEGDLVEVSFLGLKKSDVHGR